MSLHRWRKFIESDTALQVARVCRFYGIDPATYLADEDEPEPDRFEQLALAEALMLRLLAHEQKEQEAQADESSRQARVAQSMESPGSQPYVMPPTVEEVEAQLRGR